MPLRRVTLSGRLAQYESDEPESVKLVLLKGFCAVLIDVLVAVIVAAIAFKFFMNYLVAPYERGFYCHEVESLSNPFYPNTINTRHLLAVTLVTPFVLALFTEGIFFSASKGTNRLRKYFYSVTFVYLEFVLAYTIALFIMEGVKCCFARLRPHYLSVCKPDWSRINCSDPNKFIENAYCTNDDAHRIRIGRQSFPSGHSAAAILLFVFIYHYLTSLVKASNIPLLRHLRRFLLIVFGLWAVIVLVSRVTDYWHHPSDVLGGILLGLFSAFVTFARRDSSSVYERRNLNHPHLQ